VCGKRRPPRFTSVEFCELALGKAQALSLSLDFLVHGLHSHVKTLKGLGIQKALAASCAVEEEEGHISMLRGSCPMAMAKESSSGTETPSSQPVLCQTPC